MSNILTYEVGDTYPDIEGVLSYAGSVDTLLLSASFEANGNSSGAFTGDVTRVGGASEQLTTSTFEWLFSVDSGDTVKAGTFRICLKVIHGDGSIETVPLGRVKVEDELCPGA